MRGFLGLNGEWECDYLKSDAFCNIAIFIDPFGSVDDFFPVPFGQLEIAKLSLVKIDNVEEMRVVIAVGRRIKFPEHFGNGKSHPQIDQVAFVIEKILQGEQRIDTNLPVFFLFPQRHIV